MANRRFHPRALISRNFLLVSSPSSFDLAGVEHAQRALAPQGSELVEQPLGGLAAAKQPLGHLEHHPGVPGGHVGAGVVVAAEADGHEGARGVLVLGQLGPALGLLILEPHPLQIVLGHLEHEHLAGGELRLALPGGVGEEQGEGREGALDDDATAAHGVTSEVGVAGVGGVLGLSAGGVPGPVRTVGPALVPPAPAFAPLGHDEAEARARPPAPRRWTGRTRGGPPCACARRACPLRC